MIGPRTEVQAVVFSIYMDNISREVVECQRKCVLRFLPENWQFIQYKFPGQGGWPSHGQAIDDCLTQSLPPIVVVLDIDCIPLSPRSFPFLSSCCADGTLVGCVQRANHIDNNGHLYVGPCCVAFSFSSFLELGRPSFQATSRGDVGEELTYRWEECGKPVRFLWPTQVLQDLWELDSTRRFGIGTTYDDLFYHSFCISSPQLQPLFVSRCLSELKQQASHVEPETRRLKP